MLTPTLIARGPVFPPSTNRDGSIMAFSNRLDEKRDIFLHRQGETIRLTDDAEVDTEPALTPDGDRLIWSRRVSPGEWDLYEMTDEGPKVFIDGPGQQRKPRFSTDGSTLVFEDNGGIGVIRDGKRELLAPAEGDEISTRPRVSGDGKRVFWERRDLRARTRSLWMRDENGHDKELLSPESGWTGATFSRNGKQVTYSARNEEGEDLFVWHLDSNKHEILANKADVGEAFPAVSSDGQTSYYNLIDYRPYPTVHGYIFKDTNGKKEELVGRDDVGKNLFPQLSPNGKQLSWMWIDNQNPVDRALFVADVGA